MIKAQMIGASDNDRDQGADAGRIRTPAKLLRTIRFDRSDDHVFAGAAASDEWAVSGAFAFANADAGALTGKARQAFANGFLGLATFGRSTFATVSEIEARALDGLVERLAGHLVQDYGAPGREAARHAAEAELAFIADLVAEVPINTVFTVRRSWTADGEIEEEFRQIRPPSGEPLHARVWTVEPDDA